MQLTRWFDTKNTNFDEIIGKFIFFQKEYNNSSDGISLVNFSFNKVFEENQEIELNGRRITFNKINFSYDVISSGQEPLEDRTRRIQCFVIIYNDGVKVNYIISRNSDAQRVLREINEYVGKGEIVENNLEVSSDFFNWLIYKVFKNENIFEINDTATIVLESIKGFKGDTDDALTKVSADGDTVMNLISTLSFLLESSNLTLIKLITKYDIHEKIELTLNKKSTIGFEYKKYIGDFRDDGEELAVSKLLLLLYLELLPLVIQTYKEEKSNNNWNEEVYVEFLKEIGMELSGRIEEKIADIEENQ